ncbi:3-hydroxybutyryl-CoA dehydrogenase [Comamonadaceae bacterium PP-2]
MDIKTVGVVGAGTMGSGIAQICAAAGMRVVLIDVDETAVGRGVAAIRSSLERMVRKGLVREEESRSTLERVRGSLAYAELKNADVVIEAATERLEAKLRILRQIEDAVLPTCLIATNTSSLSITQLAAVLDGPQRFLGLHFFNPVPLMGLLEIIRGLQTSDEAHAQAAGLAGELGKTPVTVKNSPGFAVNRILIPMINEAVFVLQEGLATAEEIDAGMRLGCNHPIGPLALADLIGLDTLLAVMQVLYEGFKDSKYRPAPLLQEMVDARWLGRKSGRGFFAYP